MIFRIVFSHLYCDNLKHNFSAAVSSDLPLVSLVYLSIEMIQSEKLLLKFDFVKQVLKEL